MKKSAKWKRLLRFAVPVVALMLAGCTMVGVPVTPAETFTDADQPSGFVVDSFNFLSPWGYQRSANARRLYPLVVNGCWGEGSEFSTAVRQKYPAFYLDFNNHSDEGDGVLLAGLIDAALRAGWRIDPDRIYLTGFSAGGSGSFRIVRGMLAKGKLFAGIVRVAGQSESALADEAVGKTALWYNIGLDDSPERVAVARETWKNLKAHPANAGALETAVADQLTGYGRNTRSLSKNGAEIVKMSEYAGMGHTPGPCYRDPALFDWLFSQSLARR